MAKPKASTTPVLRLMLICVTGLTFLVCMFVADTQLHLAQAGQQGHHLTKPSAPILASSRAYHGDDQLQYARGGDALDLLLEDDSTLAPRPFTDNVAIVAYVPSTKPEYIAQASHMLWASWNYSRHQSEASTRNRTDLIFFVHATVMNQMPPICARLDLANPLCRIQDIQAQVEDQCYVIEHSPPTDDFWHRNKFFHSLTYLTAPAYRPLLTSYERLLRTDVDCAITPAFLTYRPDKFVVGKGGYMYDQTKPQLLQVARELNITHQGLHNIGSTWFGNATLLLDLVPPMLEVAKYILTSPVHGIEKGWPLWHVPVTSMYAGEITVNHYIPAAHLLINDKTFDVNAIGGDAIATIYHIHCWPDAYQGRYFDKWAFKRGEYTRDKYPLAMLNTSIVRDYMVAMVLYESPVQVARRPPRVTDNVAIIGYVPHTKPEYIGQANQMLWTSWDYARRQVRPETRHRTDLILFAHKSIIDQLPPSCLRLDLTHPAFMVSDVQLHADDQCYVIEHSPPTDDYWNRNKFFHSLTYLTEPLFRPLLTSYERLLRTDVDCAITPAFLTYRPSQFVVGKGGYMYEQTKPQLLQVADELNMNHQGLHNIGSTWFGEATLVLNLVDHVLHVAKFILDHPVHGVEKGWPLWHVPVTSMYAGEITINHFVPRDRLLINKETFDVNAIGGESIATIYHIHCWPDEYQGRYFDKWAFKNGTYTTDKFPRASLDTTIVRDFMMMLVLYGE
ncbi:Aste57867_9288 [Aphanomyces stellatus]|uniref:Aste57867_9288 protein n=1 Tax=Aphanomyces stellatus TaxID=120398 RepID=A0A485KMM9_9STRA|nr:hypothetical protein As57867_009252 [Aphanomyces stellatus]VFT86170.1 Aste57867_9288 [Aphanomyces stellatus]